MQCNRHAILPGIASANHQHFAVARLARGICPKSPAPSRCLTLPIPEGLCNVPHWMLVVGCSLLVVQVRKQLARCARWLGVDVLCVSNFSDAVFFAGTRIIRPPAFASRAVSPGGQGARSPLKTTPTRRPRITTLQIEAKAERRKFRAKKTS